MSIALISFLKSSISIRTLAAYLKRKGHEAFCVYCDEGIGDRGVRLLIDLLRRKGAGLAGVSLVTDSYDPSVRVTAAIKEFLGIPVIWGGAHVNVMPEECLSHADMICRGEGEEALLEVADGLRDRGRPGASVMNIWSRGNGGIVKNDLRDIEQDLDSYPFPENDLGSQFLCGDGGVRHLSESDQNGEYNMLTSRGCPYSCTYCYNNYRRKHYHTGGRYVRMRSVESVIDELVRAKEAFPDLRKVNFWDDSFVARSMDDFRKFSELYRHKVALPFFALIEPMVFNFEKIRLLKACGLTGLQIGIQSGSERVNRQVYRRAISKNRILEIARFVRSEGIDVVYDLIFNNPYETAQDIRETIRLLACFPRPVALQGYNLIFYPETEITQRALEDSYIRPREPGNEHSTIQAPSNSPIGAAPGADRMSGRFYTINYDTGDKAYLNSIFSLLRFRYLPHGCVNYFAGSETGPKRFLLKRVIGTYEGMSRARYALRKVVR